MPGRLQQEDNAKNARKTPTGCAGWSGMMMISRREARVATDVPRPTSGREYAGFFYFHEVLIPKLQTVTAEKSKEDASWLVWNDDD